MSFENIKAGAMKSASVKGGSPGENKANKSSNSSSGVSSNDGCFSGGSSSGTVSPPDSDHSCYDPSSSPPALNKHGVGGVSGVQKSIVVMSSDGSASIMVGACDSRPPPPPNGVTVAGRRTAEETSSTSSTSSLEPMGISSPGPNGRTQRSRKYRKEVTPSPGMGSRTVSTGNLRLRHLVSYAVIKTLENLRR